MATEHSFCYSTGEVLVLDGEYSPDQTWFSFVNAVFRQKTAEPSRKTKNNKALDTGVEDFYQLNFRLMTLNRVSKGRRKKLAAAKYPTFDRDGSGKLLALTKHHRVSRQTAISWCEENLIGYFVPNKHFLFETKEDYILALLSGLFEKPYER